MAEIIQAVTRALSKPDNRPPEEIATTHGSLPIGEAQMVQASTGSGGGGFEHTALDGYDPKPHRDKASEPESEDSADLFMASGGGLGGGGRKGMWSEATGNSADLFMAGGGLKEGGKVEKEPVLAREEMSAPKFA